MKKLLFVSAIFLAGSTSLFAQKGDKEESKTLSFSVGVEGSLPLGNFGNSYSFGFGGSAQGDYKISDDFAVTLNVGYITYSGKSTSTRIPIGIDPITFQIIYSTVTSKAPAFNLIPVLAGAKYWFSPNVYGSAQFGLAFASGGGTGSNFTYAPGIGFKFSQIDVLLKYLGISATGGSLNTVGLRAAYNF